jgi:PASTA domain
VDPGIAATEPLTAPRPTTVGPGGWSPRVLRRAAAIALVALALVAGGLVVMTVVNGEDRQRRARGALRPRASATESQQGAAAAPTVPRDLIGSNVAEAEAVLRGMGLKPAREAVASNQEPGTVVATDPAPGALVPEDKVVTLSVSTGSAEASPAPPGDEDGDGGKPEAPGKAKGHGHGKGKGH